MSRVHAALAAVTDGVDLIGGCFKGTITRTSTVLFHNISKKIWKGEYPELHTARWYASAIVLEKMIYVFCRARSEYGALNSIETISESALVAPPTAKWALIEVRRKF